MFIQEETPKNRSLLSKTEPLYLLVEIYWDILKITASKI